MVCSESIDKLYGHGWCMVCTESIELTVRARMVYGVYWKHWTNCTGTNSVWCVLKALTNCTGTDGVWCVLKALTNCMGTDGVWCVLKALTNCTDNNGTICHGYLHWRMVPLYIMLYQMHIWISICMVLVKKRWHVIILLVGVHNYKWSAHLQGTVLSFICWY